MNLENQKVTVKNSYTRTSFQKLKEFWLSQSTIYHRKHHQSREGQSNYSMFLSRTDQNQACTGMAAAAQVLKGVFIFPSRSGPAEHADTGGRLTAYSPIRDLLSRCITQCSNSSTLYVTWPRNIFPRVYASEVPTKSSLNSKEYSELTVSSPNNVSVTNVVDSALPTLPSPSTNYKWEELARAYVARETGMDRVKMIFETNYRGEFSNKWMIVKVAVCSTFVISFLLRYVPAWKFAREEFIRENNATVFRTQIDAVRRLNDTASFKAILEGVKFANKMTLFTAAFVFTSQVITAYTNKTTVWAYAFAAGLTGGLGRLHMGPRGFLAGSIVGTGFGTLLGCVSYLLLRSMNLTEENQHLLEVVERLQVERSIAGDSIFKKRMKDMLDEHQSASHN